MKKIAMMTLIASTLVLTGCSWTKNTPPTDVKNDTLIQQDVSKKDETMDKDDQMMM
jgi:outer membrane biogenesis lipoprotein LolB